MTIQDKIVSWLFSTRAIRVCEPDQPFWYTSGTLGPFYINTHFLYGGEDAANELLSLIERHLPEPRTLPKILAKATAVQYLENPIYHEICDLMAGKIEKLACDLISGGARRDFFFSFQVSALLGKPHLSIMKDGRTFLGRDESDMAKMVSNDEFKEMEVIHVADLVTEASSYQRAWLPAIAFCGAKIRNTLAVVDRNQGGRKILDASGVRLLSLAVIRRSLFDQAYSSGFISKAQFDMIDRFIEDPRLYMTQFIQEHPGFLEKQLEMGGKNRERAMMFISRMAEEEMKEKGCP